MRQLKITKSITNRESASLDKYLQEIGREDLITVEEEVELAQRIRKGDRVALEKLTRANLRFVVSVAKQYQVYQLRRMVDSSVYSPGIGRTVTYCPFAVESGRLVEQDQQSLL